MVVPVVLLGVGGHLGGGCCGCEVHMRGTMFEVGWYFKVDVDVSVMI